MKTIIISTVICLTFFQNLTGQIKNDQPITKGIYFIVNEKGDAIEPYGPTAGQSVFLKKFNKSGMQKWEVIPQKNGSFYIKLYESELYLEPHPAAERTAWLDSSKNGYQLVADKNSDDLWLIKSKYRKGDAMRSFVFSKDSLTELHFEPYEDNSNFKWKFIPAE